MRATEFIRNILDMIDAMDQPKVTVIDVENTEDDNPYDDEQRREEQIKDLEDDEDKFWANQPAERVADISAVTTGAGGGVNGPKHPADIRTAHQSAYPNFQAKK